MVWAAGLLRGFGRQSGESVIYVVGLRSLAHSFGGTSKAELAGFPLRGVAYVGEDGVRSCVEVLV